MPDAVDVSDPLGDELTRAQETGQVFAVVDAACFEYLQDTLTMERFTYDPLYLDEVDNPTIASGPHLIHVAGPRQIAKLREIIGDEPACVWWIWRDMPGAGEAIHRHLRGLNMVEIPLDRPELDETKQEAGYEPVLFRHADPNVMAMLLPIFEEEQVSRLFGDAHAILVDAPDVCGIRLFEVPDGLPEGSRRLLRIQKGAQYQAVTDGYTDALRNRAAREFAPRFDTPTDADRERIKAAFDRAENYGFATQGQIWSFIEMDIKHGAGFEKAPERSDLYGLLTSKDADGYTKIEAIEKQMGAA